MMDSFEIFNFFVLGIPESIALTALTVVLLKLPVNWGKIFCIGLITSLAILVFRLLMLSMGIHTAAAIIVTALLVAHFYHITKLKALIAAVVSILYLNLLELAGFLVFKNYLDLDINELAQNRWYWVIFAWVKTLLMATTALVISRTAGYRSSQHTTSK